MAENGFESIGDVLKRLGVKLDATATVEPEPEPSCLRCRDAGWVSRDGLAVECRCGVVRQRRTARIWSASQVPESMRGYTIASYADRSGKPEIAEDIQAAWEADVSRWLLLTGPVGVGKTGLAVAVLLAEIRTGASGLYVVTPSFLSRIRATYTRVKDGEVDELDVLASLIESDVLVLDDLGKVSLTEWGQEKLFTVVNDRYLARRRTIVTSNLSMAALEEHLWPATFDRIRGASDVFELDGESLR